MLDIFTLDVGFTSGEGAFRETPRMTRVQVLADSTNDAELMALEMVACLRGCPVSVAVDWDHF